MLTSFPGFKRHQKPLVFDCVFSWKYLQPKKHQAYSLVNSLQQDLYMLPTLIYSWLSLTLIAYFKTIYAYSDNSLYNLLLNVSITAWYLPHLLSCKATQINWHSVSHIRSSRHSFWASWGAGDNIVFSNNGWFFINIFETVWCLRYPMYLLIGPE